MLRVETSIPSDAADKTSATERASHLGRMRVFCCKRRSDIQRWQDFVETCPEATGCHRWEWKQIVENNFAWPTFYIMAAESGSARGILPLVLQKSWLFGKGISSMQLLQGGGILAETPEIAAQLLRAASSIAQEVGAKYVELRHERDHGLGLLVRSDKVKALLPIPKDPDQLWQSLDSRVRTSIRKAEKAGLNAEVGGKELLYEFYAVFSENMRDLGTPVYDRRFFGEILNAFPEQAHICIVRFNGEPAACDFLLGFRETIESVWAASIRKYLPLKPNMLMHWNVLRFAIQRGYRMLDFGRSTVGSGPHRYKMQWGSTEVPLHWSYWLPEGKQLPSMDRHNHKFQFAIRAWQRLPLAIANRVGPSLVRHLSS
jgi:serine/alanine adding enzyme